MRTVWICRHGHREDFIEVEPGQPAWRKTAEWPDDPGLSELGFRQARLLGQRVRGQGIAHVFASPFLRTVQTASCVADALNLPIKVEPGLSELLKSEWFTHQPELRSLVDLHRQFPRVDLSYKPRSRAVWPEENEAENAWPRVRRAIMSIFRDFEGDLVFVGHGSSCAGIVDALTGSGLDFPNPAEACSVTTLQTPGDGRGIDGARWVFRDRACVQHLLACEAS